MVNHAEKIPNAINPDNRMWHFSPVRSKSVHLLLIYRLNNLLPRIKGSPLLQMTGLSTGPLSSRLTISHATPMGGSPDSGAQKDRLDMQANA